VESPDLDRAIDAAISIAVALDLPADDADALERPPWPTLDKVVGR
jgi:hypothetical protein